MFSNKVKQTLFENYVGKIMMLLLLLLLLPPPPPPPPLPLMMMMMYGLVTFFCFFFLCSDENKANLMDDREHSVAQLHLRCFRQASLLSDFFLSTVRAVNYKTGVTYLYLVSWAQ